MQPNLFENIIQKTHRELSGSDTISRFDYQKDWAFCRMLDVHISGKEYLVAFEFHDDVVFFDSEETPNTIDFFQVKTKKSAKARTLSSLLTKKNNANSIIGKMFTNTFGVCKAHDLKLIVVSNRPYLFSSEDICANQLKKVEKEKIIEKVTVEFPQITEDFLNKLFFYVSDVPLDDIETYLKGKTLNLFEQRFGENPQYNVSSWIRLIQGEIKRKNNYSSEKISTVTELKVNKCIGKKEINSSLDSMEDKHRNAPDMQIIKLELSNKGWETNDLIRLDKALPNAIIDYNDPSNTECRRISRIIEEALNNINIDEKGLNQTLENVYLTLNKMEEVSFPYREKMYLTALTILIYYEKL